jgi:hypothetical protein
VRIAPRATVFSGYHGVPGTGIDKEVGGMSVLRVRGKQTNHNMCEAHVAFSQRFEFSFESHGARTTFVALGSKVN